MKFLMPIISTMETHAFGSMGDWSNWSIMNMLLPCAYQLIFFIPLFERTVAVRLGLNFGPKIYCNNFPLFCFRRKVWHRSQRVYIIP